MENNTPKLNLEKTCDECGGTGRDFYDEGWGTPCWKCNGSGHVVTKDGAAILQLFAHQQGSLLQFA
jgi:DnaJ-class molecular chaperone